MESEFLDEESVALDAVALSSTLARAHARISPLRMVCSQVARENTVRSLAWETPKRSMP